MNAPTENVGPPLTPLPARDGVVSLDKVDVVIDALQTNHREEVTTYMEQFDEIGRTGPEEVRGRRIRQAAVVTIAVVMMWFGEGCTKQPVGVRLSAPVASLSREVWPERYRREDGIAEITRGTPRIILTDGRAFDAPGWRLYMTQKRGVVAQIHLTRPQPRSYDEGLDLLRRSIREFGVNTPELESALANAAAHPPPEVVMSKKAGLAYWANPIRMRSSLGSDTEIWLELFVDLTKQKPDSWFVSIDLYYKPAMPEAFGTP
jgi:hypothetical protein